LEEEDHIPLESLLFSNRNSIENGLEEEDQIPSKSVLISIRNPIHNALEEDDKFHQDPHCFLLLFNRKCVGWGIPNSIIFLIVF
jgi:hypothetical protein